MTQSERDVHLPDGRTLRVCEGGDPSGRPVFTLHGTPGSRLLYPVHVEDAKRRGLRLIGYDRPGYGGSTPKPGRRKVDTAADVAAIADELGIDRFAVWGHSGGGGPALACAATLPDRVVAASSLAAPAPYPAEGLDPLDGMGELNVEDWNLMLTDRPAWEVKLAQDAEMMKAATAPQLIESMATLISDLDRAALTPVLGEFLREEMGEGLRSGVEGLRDDNLWEAQPWGFDLTTIQVPVQVWHGGQDKFVPFSHGQWLAAHVSRAEVHLEPNEGHVTLFAHRIPEVHAWLASQF